MTELSGFITQKGQGGHDKLSYWSDVSTFDADVYLFDRNSDGYPAHGQSANQSLYEYKQINQRTTVSRSLSGYINNYYVNDYYHRIHIEPDLTSLGNVLSDQTRYFYVWNAFFGTKKLNDVVKNNASGIKVESPVTPPAHYGPLKERKYTLNVSKVGSPTIDASLDFVFDVYEVTLHISGQRVILWTWKPQSKLTETLEWTTNILKTRKGEQRIALRVAPRQKFAFQIVLNSQEYAELKNIDSSFRLWGVPIWKEATSGVNASAGDTFISFDTSFADYRTDGLAVLWESQKKAVAVQIQNVQSDGIEITLGLENDWTNAEVMPLRKAYITDGLKFSRASNEKIALSVDFVVDDNIDLSKEANYDEYEGYDVLDDANVVIGDVSERLNRPSVYVDNGQGPVVIETKQDYSNFARYIGKYTKTMSDVWNLRTWLHSRYGKQKAFWLPSWNEDIVVVKDIASTDTYINIKNIKLDIYGNLPKHTRLVLNDGTVFYRNILVATELSEDEEEIEIDSSLGQSVSISDIWIWSFMDLVRLNSDKVNIEYGNMNHAQVSIPVMGVQK